MWLIEMSEWKLGLYHYSWAKLSSLPRFLKNFYHHLLLKPRLNDLNSSYTLNHKVEGLYFFYCYVKIAPQLSAFSVNSFISTASKSKSFS